MLLKDACLLKLLYTSECSNAFTFEIGHECSWFSVLASSTLKLVSVVVSLVGKYISLMAARIMLMAESWRSSPGFALHFSYVVCEHLFKVAIFSEFSPGAKVL